MTAVAPAGSTVFYTDGSGYKKVALVIGSPETNDFDTRAEKLGPDERHLRVFSAASGSDVVRKNVPLVTDENDRKVWSLT